MKKIASPDELTSELRSLLAYAESEQPSREKLASGLEGLAKRVAGDRESHDHASVTENVDRKAERDKEALDEQLEALEDRIVEWKIWGKFLDPHDPEAEPEAWEGVLLVYPDLKGSGSYSVQVSGLHHSNSRISDGRNPNDIVKELAKRGYDVDNWDLQTSRDLAGDPT